MIDSIVAGIVLACPPALTCATVVLADRARRRRRREVLNRALHELRRPLQALVLQASAGSATADAGCDQLAQALDALAGIDREVNGRPPPATRAIADARTLASDAVHRWHGPAAVEGRSLDLAWRANGSRLLCDPAAVGRALDNLIANALEHGHGPILVEGAERDGRLRLTVADGTAAGGSAPDRDRAPAIASRRRAGGRRGHGLRVVAEVAAAHGGRFASCSHAGGASAVLELPVAAAPSVRDAA